MDIKEQRDAFIKEKLNTDKTILEPSLNVCENYLNDTKIKQKRYTRKQKNILLFIFILLVISCSFNIYLLKNQNSNNDYLSSLDNISNKQDSTSSLLNETNKNETSIKNDIDIVISNDISTNNTITNETTNTLEINATTKTVLDSSEFTSEEFKKILELYAIGIHRIYDTNSDETEKNTIKLLTVLRYLDYCSQNNNSNNFSAKYAALKDNVYLCLNELTKTNYPVDILSTYNEFVKYNNNSNSFSYGDNSSILTNEKYEILELKPYDASNGRYNIETRIKRTVKYNDDTTLEDIFKVKFVVSINSNYTYSKYKIEAMYFENEVKNMPNRTYNLLDTSMFTQDNLAEIKNEIIHEHSDNENYLIYFDKINEISKNTYEISYRLILDNTSTEEKVTVSKENSKLDIDF